MSLLLTCEIKCDLARPSGSLIPCHSLHSPLGDEAFWKIAEDALVEALGSKGWAYKVDAGGGAFYGPKIDIKIQVWTLNM